MLRSTFRSTLVLLCVSTIATDREPLLIRPLRVYQSLVKGVHDYFNNTCVILFHGSSVSVEEQGGSTGDGRTRRSNDR